MDLSEFAGVAALANLSQTEQVLHLGWYLNAQLLRQRFDLSALRSCYEGLHMEVPNLSQNLSRLLERRPRVLLKDAGGFYVEHKASLHYHFVTNHSFGYKTFAVLYTPS